MTSLDDSPHLSEDERQFRQLLRRPDVFILFPTKTSVDAAELFAGTNRHRSYVLLVLDGTWREAKKMYFRSPVLQVGVALIEFSTDRMSRWSNPWTKKLLSEALRSYFFSIMGRPWPLLLEIYWATSQSWFFYQLCDFCERNWIPSLRHFATAHLNCTTCVSTLSSPLKCRQGLVRSRDC